MALGPSTVRPEAIGVVYLGVGLSSLAFLYVAVRNREKPGSRGFLLITAAVSLWAFASGASKFVESLAFSVTMYQVVLLSAALVAFGLFVLAADFTTRIVVTRRRLAVLATPLAVLVAVLWTNPLHHFFLAPGGTIHDGVFLPTYGPGFWLYVGVDYLFVAAAVALLIREAVDTRGTRRQHADIVLLSVVPPVVADVVSLTNAFGVVYDATPVGFLLSEVLLAWALYRTDFFALVPFARKTAFERMDDAVVTLDHEDRVVDYNPAASDLFGFGDDVIGRHVGEAFADYETVVDVLARQQSVDTEVVVTDGGTRRHLDLSSSRLGDESMPEGSVLVFREITALKRRQSELERKNERLDEFAGIVSHDLRNPLAVATGRVEVAREESDADDEHLETIHDALDRMERIVDETLTLARHGQTVTDPAWADFETLCRDAWAQVDTGDADLRVAASVRLRCDPDRLQRLFENFYRNAVEHGGSDVAVTVGLTDDGFYVADDGPGIPDADREAVFEPGFTSDPDGTGYGLAIVEGIAEAHGWEVSVTDSADGGARFEIAGVEKRE